MRSNREHTERVAFGLLLIGVSAAFTWILLPFLGAILWGAIIALMFEAPHQGLARRMPRYPATAAVLMVLAVVVMVILPLALLSAALAHESAFVYQQLQSGAWSPPAFFAALFDLLPGWLQSLLERFGLSNFDILQSRLTGALKQGSQWIASQILAIGQNAFEFIASLFITLYLAFFLLRDGRTVSRAVLAAVPLAPAHQQALLGEFTTVIRATVRGSLLVSAAQGLLGGLAFWFLDVSGALLWAVLMAVLSLLPAVGAGLVWLPVAVYFLISGSIGPGLGLIAYGVLVIGLVDNLLRPILVGQQTRLPDYLVLLSTLGGIVVFGLNGFVIGPAIAAVFLASWKLYGQSWHEAPPDPALPMPKPAEANPRESDRV